MVDKSELSEDASHQFGNFDTVFQTEFSGWENSYAQFEHLLQDNVRLLQIMKEATHDIGMFGTYTIFGRRIESRPLINQVGFLKGITFESAPEDLNCMLNELIQKRPALLFELNLVLNIIPGVHELELQKKKTTKKLHQASPEDLVNILRKLSEIENAEAVLKKTVFLDWLRTIFGDVNYGDDEHVRDWIVKIDAMVEQWRELVYTHHVLSKASELLGILIPSMASEINHFASTITLLQPRLLMAENRNGNIFKRLFRSKKSVGQKQDLNFIRDAYGQNRDLLGVQSKSESNEKQDDVAELADLYAPSRVMENPHGSFSWWYAEFDKKVTITIPPFLSSSADETYAEDVIVMAHELMHAVLSKLLHIQIDSRYRHGKQAKSTLGIAIHEGVSIAVEHELLNILSKDGDGDKTMQRVANQFGIARLKDLRKSNRQLRRENRSEPILFDFFDKTSALRDTGIAYSEGAKLAIALRRNGWRISDLPILVSKISEKVTEITNIKKPFDWSSIEPQYISSGMEKVTKRLPGVLRNLFVPDYQRVMKALRELCPS